MLNKLAQASAGHFSQGANYVISMLKYTEMSHMALINRYLLVAECPVILYPSLKKEIDHIINALRYLGQIPDPQRPDAKILVPSRGLCFE